LAHFCEKAQEGGTKDVEKAIDKEREREKFN
jgi:hypothetical protein